MAQLTVKQKSSLSFKDIEVLLSHFVQEAKQAKEKQVEEALRDAINLKLNATKILKRQLMRLAAEKSKQPVELTPDEVLAFIQSRINGENAAAEYYLQDNCLSMVEEVEVRTDMLEKLRGSGLNAFLVA